MKIKDKKTQKREYQQYAVSQQKTQYLQISVIIGLKFFSKFESNLLDIVNIIYVINNFFLSFFFTNYNVSEYL